jgi:hyaluronoglucosaminidase
VPDVNNNGLVIIDFESWRPIFRQNWAALAPYKDVSYQIEKTRHPFWSEQWREAEVIYIEHDRRERRLKIIAFTGRASI